MWEKINNFLKGQIVTSIIYIALGACLAFMPMSTVNVICKFVFGILLILVGLYHILIYIAEKLNSTIFDLFTGGILMVIGIFLFMNPQIVVKLLPVLLGTFILVDSIWTLKGSFKLKKHQSGFWKFLMAGSILFIVLGVALIINPFTMVQYTIIFAGAIFMVNGAIDLIDLLLLRKGLKELKQDIEAVDAPSEIINDDSNEEVTENTADFAQPEPEYASWSTRNMKETESNNEIQPSDENQPENEESDRELSEMEKSLDATQSGDEEKTAMPKDEALAERGAYVVDKATVTDDDLSDTKDENLIGMFSRKRKNRMKS